MLKAEHLPAHRFHDLRHTAATLLVVLSTQKRFKPSLGWGQVAMVERYSHFVHEMRKEAASD